MEKKIYAAVDANINRALEGLRVCEDIFRFVITDSEASSAVKNARHKIAEAVNIFSGRLLIDGRDVENDTIKFLDLDSGQTRDSLDDLLKRNLHRAMEALRSIEEFFKILNINEKNPFQEIRFSLYSLEKKIFPVLERARSRAMMRSLYAILDSSFVWDNMYLQTARRLIDGGASVIQLRMKQSSKKAVLAAARDTASLCRERGVLFIVNDFAEIAYLSDAGGVHLGQEDLPVQEARRLLPRNMVIGISTHTPEEAVEAGRDDPDYIAIGPVFDTGSKGSVPLKGIGTGIVKDIIDRVNIPVVAIGGINSDNVTGLKKAGCTCFSVMSYLYRNDSIEDNCREIIKKISL